MKLFLDQNLSYRIAEVLKSFYEMDHPDLVCVHLTQKYGIGFSEGVNDLDWISDLSAEGGWIIFTVDRGRSSTIQPLPQICSRLKVTHVLVGEQLARPSILKQAIVACWDQLLALSAQPAGTRVKLHQDPGKHGYPRYTLQQVELTRIFDGKSRQVKLKTKDGYVPKTGAKRAAKRDPGPPDPDLFNNR